METLRRWMQDWSLGREEAARARARRRLAATPWPAPLLDVMARLRADGRRAYLVGGSVRDALLDRPDLPAADGAFDVATDLTPDEVVARFPRVEPIGLRHGTVLILADGVAVESTTFRLEGAYSDARRPDRVTFTDDPLADLDRRDFTVNAMAWDESKGQLLDPHGGAADLERRRLVAVGEPLDRFREDALRPLRAARFAATHGLVPDAALERALEALARGDSGVDFGGVAAERVRDELMRLMAAPRPSVGFEWLRAAGLLERWLPEIARMRGVPQNRWHAYDVYFHTLYTVDAAPAGKPVVRWAALLHDVGKPDTRVEREGEGTFYDHERVGAGIANRMLERLRFPTALREAVVHLVREHMFDLRPEWSDAAVRRWLRRVGPDTVADLFDLRIADVLGNGRRGGFPVYLDAARRRIERVLAESAALSVADLAIDGRDVMRTLTIPSGPEVGRALERLLEEVLEDPARNTREHLLSRLSVHAASAASVDPERGPDP